MNSFEILQALAISLGLGMLIGLQREWKESEIAGIRTFPLITLLGTLSVLAGDGVGWLSASGLLALAAMLVVANISKMKADQYEFGMTTEVAALLMYVVGCALGLGWTAAAVVTAGITAVLLHWKDRLHGWVDSMTGKDLKAVINLAIIGLVILPLLPDETYGPYDVLNPYKIWLMVVLIVGISMVAYVASKLLGARVGSILGGILGGLISSTATTVSFARKAKEEKDLSSVAALVILIASTIVNVRVLIEIGVVAPTLLNHALAPMTALLLLMIVECVLLYFSVRSHEAEQAEYDNPAELKPAVIFGALYAVVLILVAAGKDWFGSQALYWIAGVSGLTDVDAITLSTARLYQQDQVAGETAWRVILLATMSNLVFKAGAVAVLGNRRLLVYTVITFAIALAGGGLLLAFWPGAEVMETFQF